jgi:predicted dehydrogenase
MEPVRLGVVGCGVIGSAHLAAAVAIPETCKLVALADLIDDRAEAAVRKYGATPGQGPIRKYRSGAELIEKDAEVEMVILAFPVAKRTAEGLRAFRCGKHLLTEKPVAMNAAEVRQLIAARGGLTGGCCQSRFRFFEHAKVAAKFLATGALGKLRLVRARELRPAGEPPKGPPPTWRLRTCENGGGILMNWGCYDLDYVLGLTGWALKPVEVLAGAWAVPPSIVSHVPPDSDAETHFAAMIRCEGGAVFSFERGEYMPAAADEAWQIIGEKGSLRLKMTPGKGKTVIHDELTPGKGVVSHTIWQGDEDFGGGTALHVDFAQAVRQHRQPLASLEQALLVQEISDAIYESARMGTAVKVGG